MSTRLHRSELLFGQDGHLTDEGVALFVDALKLGHVNELPVEIRNHVGDCFKCKLEIVDLNEATRELDYSNIPDNPFVARSSRGSRKPGNLPFFFRIAAILIAAIGIGYLALLQIRPKNTSTNLASNKATTNGATSGVDSVAETGHAHDLGPLATKFVPDGHLEYAVGSNLRGSPVELLAPGIGDSVQFPLTFKWGPSDFGTVVIEVVTNTDSLVFRQSVSANHAAVEKPFSPGVYYWKMLKDGELLAVGKFFVPAHGWK